MNMTLSFKDRARLGLIAFLMLASHASADGIDELYRPYAAMLADFVTEHELPDDGLVSAFDYQAALADAETADRLATQRRQLAEFDPDTLNDRESNIAFWLNAYNFFMVAHILENPRRGELISSVRDYGSLFNPYRVFRRDLFDIGGRKYSLSEIENDILLGEDFKRRGWKDARVHFAVNCASVGCPPLRNVPYTADNVEALLAENTRRALNTPLNLRIEDDVLHLTSLFDWYEDHFVNQAGSVRQFIAENADENVREVVNDTRTIHFIDYDWDLNSPENMQPWTE